MRARKEKSTIRWAIRPLFWGLAAGIAACAVLLLAAAALMAGGMVPLPWTMPLSLAIATIAAFLGGFVTAAVSRTTGWLFGSLTGLLLCCVLMLVGVLLGNPNGVGLLLKIALTVGGGAVGGILGVNAKKR